MAPALGECLPPRRPLWDRLKPINENRFPRRKIGSSADGELSEYGVLLLRAGAVDEGLRILNQVDPAAAPEVLLYRAFGHFSRWQFLEAIPILETYIRSSVSEYEGLVGRVNLAFALIETQQFDLAKAQIDEVFTHPSRAKYLRLQSNCLAMQAQVHLQRRNLNEAKSSLEAAQRIFDTDTNFGANDQSFIRKTKLIIESLESHSLAPLKRLRTYAQQNREWETLREVDLFSLQIEFKYERFLHLIFGTPSARFRERICQDVISLPDRTHYVLGPKSAPRLNLEDGTISSASFQRPSRKTLQLFNLLLNDFFQPMRIAALFFGLFPGEHFDAVTSPNRVHQTISRARAWLKSEKIPLNISENDGFFSVEIQGDFSILVPLERGAAREVTYNWDRHWDLLRSAFVGSSEFSAQAVCDRLSLSRSSVQRLLSRAVADGKVIQLGQKRGTIYKLTPSSTTRIPA